ncbi:MAG: cupin domain-containing protein [Cytophagaceae bacterium]
MIHKGDTMHSPVKGQTITIIQSTADTKGEFLQIGVSMEYGTTLKGVPVHTHPRQEERFTIKSGWMRVMLNGEERYYGPGESFTIPPGVSHQWWNARRNENLEFISEFRPAMESEKIIEVFSAVCQEGKVKEDGTIPFLQKAVILDKYPDHFALAGIPLLLQKLLFKLLSPIARLAGYTASPEYRAPVKKQDFFKSAHVPV